MIPPEPTITNFGADSDLFFFTVKGPAGASYGLWTSTNLYDWDFVGSTTTNGSPIPPSGFVLKSEVGPKFYIRLSIP